MQIPRPGPRVPAQGLRWGLQVLRKLPALGDGARARPWRGPSGGRSAEPAGRPPSSTQASVYCVAAVLWTAAKFSVPRDHKLALPRRLKTLLLHMARRSAQERPSAAEAIEDRKSVV